MIERGDIYRFSRPGGPDHLVACLDVVNDADAVRDILSGQKVGAIIADPPYSSGGLHAGSRRQTTTKKYQHNGGRGLGDATYENWDFDGLDQRSWTRWCAAWLSDLRRYSHRETYAMVFCDWRQLSALTDAIQMGGWFWRGIGVWDKGRMARAAHKGYFRHQAEFMLGAGATEHDGWTKAIPWATAGELTPPSKGGPGPFDGVFSHSVVPTKDKWHLAAKPVAVLLWLLSVLGAQKDPGVVVDPFAGSLSGAIAADEMGSPSISFEVSPGILDKGIRRINQEGFQVEGYDGQPLEEGHAPRQLALLTRQESNHEQRN